MTDLTQMLAALAAMFTHPPMTPDRMGVYRFALADLTGPEIETALRSLLADPTRQFYPTSGEIRAAARPAPTIVATAPLFGQVEWHVLTERGTLRTIEDRFGPDARAAASACGGLEAFRTLDHANNRPHVLKAFTAAMIECHYAPATPQIASGPAVAALVADVTAKLTAGRPS
jgi:hypothetical protein